jgi:hypothetical protein
LVVGGKGRLKPLFAQSSEVVFVNKPANKLMITLSLKGQKSEDRFVRQTKQLHIKKPLLENSSKG